MKESVSSLERTRGIGVSPGSGPGAGVGEQPHSTFSWKTSGTCQDAEENPAGLSLTGDIFRANAHNIQADFQGKSDTETEDAKL